MNTAADRPPAVRVESAMITIMAMTALCVMGVAFYVRFLVALFNECKHQPKLLPRVSAG